MRCSNFGGVIFIILRGGYDDRRGVLVHGVDIVVDCSQIDLVKGLRDLVELFEFSSAVSIGSPASRLERFGGVHTSCDMYDRRRIGFYSPEYENPTNAE